MKKCVTTENGKIIYELTYKRVKNINLRITLDGAVKVSANKFVPQKLIDDFLIEKGDFILKSLEMYKKTESVPQKQYFSEDALKGLILDISNRIYPYFKKKAVQFPEIKFRKMVSRWGSCHPQKRVLTFNTNLKFVPEECVEYVVLHEFTHFLVGNHSSEFYKELSKTCPLWKEWRKKLKEVYIR